MSEQKSPANPTSLEHEATMLRNQGRGYESVTLYEQAKRAYKTAGDEARAAGCQHMIGVSYKIENDLEKAIPAYEQAIADYQAAEDPLGPGRVYRDMGIMYEYHDRMDEAEEYLLKSVGELRRLPSDQSFTQSEGESAGRDAELGISIAKVGVLYTRTDRLDQAAAQFDEALTLIRGVGHPHYEMTTLMHYGEYQFRRGEYGAMLNYLQAALGVLDEYSLKEMHTRRLGQIWGWMAHGYLGLENKVVAKRFARKSLEVIDGLSDTAKGPLEKDVQAEKLRALLTEE